MLIPLYVAAEEEVGGLLSDNLVAYWSLDEASGNAIDAHDNNDLTDNNTVAAQTGKVSGARDFEAANSEYFSRADNSELSTGNIDFTCAAWVYLESKPATFPIAVGKFSALGDQREWAIFYHSGNDRLAFIISTDGTAAGQTILEANNLGAPSTATWYYVIVWHDSVNNTLNIQVNNGTTDSVAHSGGVLDGTGPFQMGTLLDEAGVQSQFWDGLIDEVGFWKRVLTSDERTELYDGGNGRDYDYIINGPLAGNVLLLQDGSPFLLQDGSRLLLQEEITEGSPNARRFGKKPFGVQGIRIY